MKPILVLAPPAGGLPRRERSRLDVCRGASGADGLDAAGYSAVIVLNDGRAGTIGRLRRALALRERDARLGVGVLTYLDAGSAAAAAAATAAAASGEVALRALGPGLRVELKDEVLCLEYAAA